MHMRLSSLHVGRKRSCCTFRCSAATEVLLNIGDRLRFDKLQGWINSGDLPFFGINVAVFERCP